jgi:hypothetical protein
MDSGDAAFWSLRTDLCARSARGLLTRMVRWGPGLDTSIAGQVAQDHFEEVLILSGIDARSRSPANVQRRVVCLPATGHGSRPVDHGRVLRQARVQYAG